MADLLLILVAFAIGGWVQGVVGFGFAVATTLILVNKIDFTALVFLNLCMSVLTSLIAMLSGRNLKSIAKVTLGKLILSASAGLAIGMAILSYIDGVTLKKITLVVILTASLVSLSKNKAFFAHAYMAWIGGFFSGILTPSTGINGPLVALHLNAAFKDKEKTRNTMLSYLFLIMIFGVVSMSLHGSITSETWSTVPKIALPSIAGYSLGMITFRQLSDTIFKFTVTFFLILSSILSLVYLIL
jgi:uncharacterized membrane protein YfcA